MADTTYINEGVYNKQGGNTLVVASGGSIVAESGGSFTSEDGFNFYLGGDTVALGALNMNLAIKSLYTYTNYISDTVNVSQLTTSLLTSYGYMVFSCATGCSKTSAKLAVPKKGAVIALNFSQFVGDANISVFAQSGGGLAGVSLVNLAGVNLSSFEVSAAGSIKLICHTSGLWSVVAEDASVTERAA